AQRRNGSRKEKFRFSVAPLRRRVRNIPYNPCMYKFLHIVLILTTVQLLHAQEKPQTFTAQGITIELTAMPAVAGEEMKVQFKITDANGTALSSLRPVAWIDQRQIGLPM